MVEAANGPQWQRRLAVLLALTAAFSVGFVIGAYCKFGRPCEEFVDHQHAIIALLDFMRDNPPDYIVNGDWGAEKAWTDLCSAAVKGVANALYFPSTVSVEEVTRIEAELRGRLERDPQPDVNTNVWFWERMGECSWSAKSYIVGFRPWFDEFVEEVTRRKPNSDQREPAAPEDEP